MGGVEAAIPQPALAEGEFVLGIDERSGNLRVPRVDAARAKNAVRLDRADTPPP